MVNDWICLFRNSWPRRRPGQAPQKVRSHNRESRPKDRGQAGDPRKAKHLILVFILVCPWEIHFPSSKYLWVESRQLIISLNVKSWPENWNEILAFKDWNLSELVELSRDGGPGQGGHYHDALDNGRNAGGQVCNQITNCCAELQFKLLISQRLTLCENTNYNRQLMFSLKSNRQSFFINIFLRHVKLCSFVRTWNWKLGIKFDLFSPALKLTNPAIFRWPALGSARSLLSRRILCPLEPIIFSLEPRPLFTAVGIRAEAARGRWEGAGAGGNLTPFPERGHLPNPDWGKCWYQPRHPDLLIAVGFCLG